MKKLLLAMPIVTVLSACGSQSVEDVANEYCVAIKKHDWRSAQYLATPDALRNREAMYDNYTHKYSNVFLSQNCDVTKTDQNSETEYSVYFGGSKLDSVEIQWDEEKEQFFVTSDAFKNDLKLY
ncbi:hypothetical protein [Colwellia sp. MB3u-4]|jgi:hypothetical protein|uniref:hypothetical protein n=1 Tax=Colwellia sp. MB3u-4 TaxID=2759822 RepID=UPI0015F781A4|nr:hypothetical protein [Colwellia sp. MB3u-4]MBA6287763.1 hypothetical protein [Colwellia sp. MB3u-4]